MHSTYPTLSPLYPHSIPTLSPLYPHSIPTLPTSPRILDANGVSSFSAPMLDFSLADHHPVAGRVLIVHGTLSSGKIGCGIIESTPGEVVHMDIYPGYDGNAQGFSAQNFSGMQMHGGLHSWGRGGGGRGGGSLRYCYTMPPARTHARTQCLPVTTLKSPLPRSVRSPHNPRPSAPYTTTYLTD